MSQTQPFEAEVGRVLDLVINSLYKEREIFLRELISNASDASDKLRYESLSRPELLADDPEPRIRIHLDPNERLLTIVDNGIGMDRDELVANLGTIARSGTARFLDRLSGDKSKDMKLIGQFGVGFYSAFMVADRVVVQARKAGETQGWRWASDGRSGFTVEEADEPLPRGVAVSLHLKEDAGEFLSEWRLRDIVRTYSDHIALPIILEVVPKAGDTKTRSEPQQINAASALWARPRSEITDEQYKELYHHVGHSFDDPFARVHFSAEGALTYTGLLFVPSQKPFDLWDPKRRHGVKLYVRRVFITDRLDELMPRWLRFVTGVVDSEDLQLNVSRETLQHGAVVARMRKALVKRLLDELARKARGPVEGETPAEGAVAEQGGAEPEGPDGEPASGDWDAWWAEFGPVMKEGLYEEPENRGKLLEIARFRSSRGPGWTSLADYVRRMKEGQEAIYYISGESVDALRSSPQLEAARAKGVEVLLLDDPVDEFWIPAVGEFQGRKFQSLTKGDVDLSAVKDEAEAPAEAKTDDADLGRLIARIKLALGTAVKDVRASKRLRDSAVCLVAEDSGMDMRLERFMKQHNQLDALGSRILELNPGHALIRRMAEMAKDESGDIDELSRLLLDQARIVEGEPVPDPGAFSRRMSTFLARGLAA
ncbi:MAG TPA: molecular chaperone HtpG [Geminicoccaceae bacterium]|nr:molecular chaperone HtpG [Geminicoccus sp.]HMU51134.1 molecular chaperone HtpG [Geminicoccaceae bacterium]